MFLGVFLLQYNQKCTLWFHPQLLSVFVGFHHIVVTMTLEQSAITMISYDMGHITATLTLNNNTVFVIPSLTSSFMWHKERLWNSSVLQTVHTSYPVMTCCSYINKKSWEEIMIPAFQLSSP
jgi:hypothetical protein